MSTPLERAAAVAALAPDTPELVLDLDVVRANVARAAAMARDAGVSLRPHTKTHKLPEIARLQVEAGAVGVQVAKLGEAEVMADAGIEDILVGYPIVGAQKLARLADLAERVADLGDGRLRRGCRGHLPCGAGARAHDPCAGRARYRDASPRAPAGHTGRRPRRAGRRAPRRRARRRLHPRGPRLHPCPRRRRARAADPARRAGPQSTPPRRSAAVGCRRRSSRSARPGRSASRSGAPGVTEVRPGTYVFNDRSQIAQGAATRCRPRRVRGRRRSSAVRCPSASSSTPARRC